MCILWSLIEYLSKKRVYEKKLINIEERMLISESVVIIKRELRDRRDTFQYMNDKKDAIQYTNLLDNRQVEVEVDNISVIALYDYRMILLILLYPLIGTIMEDVFRSPNTSIFKDIEYMERVDTQEQTLHFFIQ